MTLCRVMLMTIAMLGGASMTRAAPALLYSQDQKKWTPIDAVVGRATPRSFYNYRDLGGHPAFGSEKSTVTAAIYWDRKRSTLSLVTIAGSGERGDNGMFGIKYNGLPWVTQLAVSDDPHEFEYDKGQKSAQARFVYRNNSDGLVFSGLERTTWLIKLSLQSQKGIRYLRLADGADSPDGDFVDLNVRRPLYLKMASLPTKEVPSSTPVVPPTSGDSGGGSGGGGVTTPVPEPGGSIVLLALASLLIRPRSR